MNIHIYLYVCVASFRESAHSILGALDTAGGKDARETLFVHARDFMLGTAEADKDQVELSGYTNG